jgi:hypothetical protein
VAGFGVGEPDVSREHQGGIMALFRRKRRATSFEDPILGKETEKLNVNEAFEDPILGKDSFEDPILGRDDFETPVFQEEEGQT